MRAEAGISEKKTTEKNEPRKKKSNRTGWNRVYTRKINDDINGKILKQVKTEWEHQWSKEELKRPISTEMTQKKKNKNNLF